MDERSFTDEQILMGKDLLLEDRIRLLSTSQIILLE